MFESVQPFESLNTNCSSHTLIQIDVLNRTLRPLSVSCKVCSCPAAQEFQHQRFFAHDLPDWRAHFETFQTTWCQGRAVHERFRVRQLRERELLACEFCTAGRSMLQLWVPRFPPSLTLEAVSFAVPIKDVKIATSLCV